MNKRIAIVTGASSGFGLLTSLQLARHGFYVIATMRNKKKSENLISKAEEIGCKELIEIHELDVTKAESIDEFFVFIQQLGKVDVLVNNAGYASAGFVEEIPLTEYRKQFETNFFGLINITQNILPIMRKQGSGKIINVSSISGMIGFPGLSPYVASKHALEGWSETLRLEMKPFGIDVSLVEPGSFKTNIWSSGKKVTEKSLKEDSPYFAYMNNIEAYINRGESQFGDPNDVAIKIVEIALKKNPDLRYPIGKGVNLTINLKNFLSWKLWEKLFLKRLT